MIPKDHNNPKIYLSKSIKYLSDMSAHNLSKSIKYLSDMSAHNVQKKKNCMLCTKTSMLRAIVGGNKDISSLEVFVKCSVVCIDDSLIQLQKMTLVVMKQFCIYLFSDS